MTPQPTPTENYDGNRLDIASHLALAEAYQDFEGREATGQVRIHETHISWVFLTDRHAFKVKKPVRTPFLDYSTLALRKHYCEEEVRLDRRYAPELYVGVVPITSLAGRLSMGGTGNVVDYAVQMLRFPDDALLSERLARNSVSHQEIMDLAGNIARFHADARVSSRDSQYGEPHSIYQDAIDNLDALDQADSISTADKSVLRNWTEQSFGQCREQMKNRKLQGCIRECHGDLHAGNIIFWRGKWTPFDGIEFSDGFRWIDVLSDAAFLAMDLAAGKHDQLANLFVNAYLECSGDYRSLQLFRWYEVYRTLVRAKVDCMRMQQEKQNARDAMPTEMQQIARDLDERTQFAFQLMRPTAPRLWITHGVSGSGKSTVARNYVERYGAICLRSDVERKRLFGKPPTFRPETDRESGLIYSHESTRRTYLRLRDIARDVLVAGYPVIVDATFLSRTQRGLFRELADELRIPLQILDCQADTATLQRRILDRSSTGNDASDADLTVLDAQLKSQELLDEEEVRMTLSIHPG